MLHLSSNYISHSATCIDHVALDDLQLHLIACSHSWRTMAPSESIGALTEWPTTLVGTNSLLTLSLPQPVKFPVRMMPHGRARRQHIFPVL